MRTDLVDFADRAAQNIHSVLRTDSLCARLGLFHGVQADHVWVIAGNMFRQGALVVPAPVLQPIDRSISGAKEQMTKTSLSSVRAPR
jgi:hypothetical protein